MITLLVLGTPKRQEFQAETKQLLDIVAKSLYSEKEVFIREVISNASDALEKVRHFFLTGKDVSETETSLEIMIETDQEAGTFTIQDNGVGMTEEELMDHLGVIAKSGSKVFMEKLKNEARSSHENIIGQFGVGFYSTFMVADKVDVYTKSYQPNSQGYFWTSDGSGSYEYAEANGVARGTKLVLHLKEDCKRFAMKTAVEDIVQRYSNFVGFPIYLNGVCINTIQPLWTLEPRDISKEQHDEFYQFLSKGYDKPRYYLHYKTDAPLNIRSIFYFPETLPQMFNMQQMESGISLYSRRVLIQAKAEKVLPRWLRFIRGVVDSEDIPLNLSRELLQDSALIKKLSNVLSARLVKFLQEQARKDRVKYEKFFKDCGIFIREGVVTTEDEEQKEEIAKLLLFESSNEKPGTLTNLPAYVSRMKPTQKKVYYLCAPSRDLAETSPYYETLKQNDVEVLFSYNEQDDVVLHYLRKYENKAVISAENFLSEAEDTKPKNEPEVEDVTPEEGKDLAGWMSSILGPTRVVGVKVSKRLANTNHPAMITVPDMVAAKHWLKLIKTEHNKEVENMKYQIIQPTLEINPKHDLIKRLEKARGSNTELATLITNQMYDNALIAAVSDGGSTRDGRQSQHPPRKSLRIM
ncbi:predicted protein, partial [Nematostella vectensis]